MEYQEPVLFYTWHRPQKTVKVIRDESAFQGKKAEPVGSFSEICGKTFQGGDSFIVDFGDHYVGELTLKLGVEGINDSPAKIDLRFAEIAPELEYPTQEYDGWLNSAWFYQETVYADVLPCEIKLPRRYAFRYMQVNIAGSVYAYKLRFDDILLMASTSADASKLKPLPENADPLLKRIDAIATRTLSECMQTVFEDGPKRDRRLWIGDMRLQALTNYATFQNTQTVLYCMRLFNDFPIEGGYVSPCMYHRPEPHPDCWYFADYALFFVSCLYDYYLFSNDREVLQHFWSMAYRQLLLADKLFTEDGIFSGGAPFFVDWCPNLEKTVSSIGICIFAFKQGLALAEILEEEQAATFLRGKIEKYTQQMLSRYYDKDKRVFLSNGQISLSSQAWAVLADVLPQKQLLEIMENGEAYSETMPETTPYMKHIILEAYWKLGQQERVISIIKEYWGKMADYGADTFFELFNDRDHQFSTGSGENSYMLNSYCHAWSCTPAWFIRKYYDIV